MCRQPPPLANFYPADTQGTLMAQALTITSSAPRPRKLRRRALNLQSHCVGFTINVLRDLYSLKNRPAGFPIKIQKDELESLNIRFSGINLYCPQLIEFPNKTAMLVGRGDCPPVLIGTVIDDGQLEIYPWGFHLSRRIDLRRGGYAYIRSYQKPHTHQISLVLKSRPHSFVATSLATQSGRTEAGIPADLKRHLAEALADEIADWCAILSEAASRLSEKDGIWPPALCSAKLCDDPRFKEVIKAHLALASRAIKANISAPGLEVWSQIRIKGVPQLPGGKSYASRNFVAGGNPSRAQERQMDRLLKCATSESALPWPAERIVQIETPHFVQHHLDHLRGYKIPHRKPDLISGRSDAPTTAHEQIETKAFASHLRSIAEP